MTDDGDKVLCRTPNQPGGGKGTRIDTWKYEVMSAAIRACFTARNNAPLGFMAMVKAVPDHVDPARRDEIGSLGWFTTTVALEMQYRGEMTATKVSGKKMLVLT